MASSLNAWFPRPSGGRLRAAEGEAAGGAAQTESGEDRRASSGGRTTGLVADPLYKRHDTGSHHPESPARFDAVMRGLHGLERRLVRIPAREAAVEELHLCHTPEYVETVQREIAAGRRTLSTGDTDISPDSWRVALHAAGGALNAVDAVIGGEADAAFCAVRPPGHHATPVRGMGFCLFNNAALAARYAQRRHGLGKVLIADWDVHHGNGTQDIFYEDDSVLFFSTHQSPWYPGTGEENETGAGRGLGFTINCPFPAGSGRREILRAFQDKLAPAAERFRPELVVISAGFDSRQGDPLGRFTLSDEDFADLTALLLEIAGKYAGGRVVSVLEGGYNLHGLASAARSHVAALAGE